MNFGSLPYGMWTKIVQRSLYNECQHVVPNNISKGEDLVFTINLLERCQSIYMLDYYGYHYRINNSSITNKYNDSDISNLRSVINLILSSGHKHEELYKNKVYVYAAISFWNLARSFAKQKGSLKVFVSFMKKECDSNFDEYFREIKLKKAKFKDTLKLFLLKKHLWKFIYFVSKIS